MKRILITKNDTLASVVGKMVEAEDAELTLVIPRQSVFQKDPTNFNLIKREIIALEKQVRIESVDEGILQAARSAGIAADHPLWSSKGVRAFSDIVPGGKTAAVPKRVPVPQIETKGKGGPRASVATTPEPSVIARDDEGEKPPAESFAPVPPRGLRVDWGEPEEAARSEARKAKRRKRNVLAGMAFVALLLVAGTWAVSAIFSRATIVVNFKKVQWGYEKALVARKSLGKIDTDRNALPAELFKDSKNFTQLFPASSKAKAEERATGRMVVWNAFSSSPQTLVSGTRFTDTQGKTFRLDTQIEIPGAKVSGGKITPSSVEANVTADKPGAEYNLPAETRFTIPGFKGTARYDGFYGALKEAARGGFIGERAVPTEADIKAATERTEEILRTGLRSNFLTVRPEGFVVPEDAVDISITRLIVKKETDEQGNFTVFGEAQLRALAFRESDIRSLLGEIAGREHPETKFQNLSLAYESARSNFASGELTFTVKAQGVLTAQFGAEEFRAKILGEKVGTVRALILALPGVADGKVYLQPFWLSRIPSRSERVHMRVD